MIGLVLAVRLVWVAGGWRPRPSGAGAGESVCAHGDPPLRLVVRR